MNMTKSMYHYTASIHGYDIASYPNTIHNVSYVLNITEDSSSAGDYPSSNLMCYSGETATSFTMDSHCQEHSKKILSCEFRIHLTARTIITRLLMCV